MAEPVPDYAEALSGWRVWLVARSPAGLRLVSVVYHALWEPGCELAAECMHWRPSLLRPWRSRGGGHEPPGDGCRCGIYAASEVDGAADYLEAVWGEEPLRWPVVHRVIGRVSLWGTVVECERGFRGGRAYPERLWVPARDRAGRALERAPVIASALGVYGVPVELIDAAGAEVAGVLAGR
jgi:hypothetical protein